jgi:hypothetical protein
MGPGDTCNDSPVIARLASTHFPLLTGIAAVRLLGRANSRYTFWSLGVPVISFLRLGHRHDDHSGWVVGVSLQGPSESAVGLDHAAPAIRISIISQSLLLADLANGWVCGEPNVAIRKALGVTTAACSAAVRLASVTSNFVGTPAVTAVVAYAPVSILSVLGFGVLSGNVATKEMLLDSRARRS